MRTDELIDWIHHARRFGEKKGLSNMEALMAALGNPDRKLKCVHVAGTNAKGSVCAMLESALRANGFLTGLYTSPYLMDYRERIRIAGLPIDEALFEWAGDRVRAAVESLPDVHPTAFELGTALAFFAFAHRGVEIAVIETGIGGRLDPTNILTPEVCAIANIGFDHMEQLGGTIEEIAFEKAGIIKPGAPVALYPQSHRAAVEVIEKACAERGAPLLNAEALPFEALEADRRGAAFVCDIPSAGRVHARIPLAGRHQIENARLAMAALSLLGERGFPLRADRISEGIAKTRWPGRLEWLGERFLLDGAHNPQAARALAAYVREFVPGRVVLLTAMMRDKQPEACADILAPLAASAVATQVPESRALDAGALKTLYAARGVPSKAVPELASALDEALDEAGSDGTVIACGSLYLAGALLRILSGRKSGTIMQREGIMK